MEYIIHRSNEDYLQHFGIKGQKWGVRRFENKDGTLTSEGRERYYKKIDKIAKKEQIHRDKEDNVLMKAVNKGKIAEGIAFIKALHHERAANKLSVKQEEMEKKIYGYMKDIDYQKWNDGSVSTNSEGAFNYSSLLCAEDKRSMAEVKKALDSSKDNDVKIAKSIAKDLNIVEDQLNKKFQKYASKFEKWDGDGTELHYAMEKRFPDYKRLSKQRERLISDLCKSGLALSKKDEFAKNPTLIKFPRYLYQLSDHFRSGSAASYAIISSLLGKSAYEYGIFPDAYLIEDYTNNREKIKMWWEV